MTAYLGTHAQPVDGSDIPDRELERLEVERETPQEAEIIEAILLDDWFRDEGDYLQGDNENQSAELLAIIKCMTRAQGRRDKEMFDFHARTLGELIHARATTAAVEIWEANQ